MRRNLALFLRVVLFAACVPNANASPELRQAAIVSTMTEAAVSFATLIKDRTGRPLRGFTWSSKYSDRNWVISGSGSAGDRKVTVSMSGYLWGEDDQDMVLTYAGNGSNGEEPILLHGKATWFFDKKSKDYTETDFHHVMKLGANSVWGWVVGSETLVGGTIGAGAAIATASVATGGLALGASAWIGAGGAIAGSSALISVSNTVRVMRESSQPLPAPQAPRRPARPSGGEPIGPQVDRIHIALAKDGRIEGTGPDGSTILSGQFDNKSGTAKAAMSEFVMKK